jgi:hypothetical protein
VTQHPGTRAKYYTRLITDDGALRPDAIIRNPDTGCWLWQGSIVGGTKPVARYQGKNANIRRVIFERSGNTVPAGWSVRPECRVGACVNPEHTVAIPPHTQRQARTVNPNRWQRKLGKVSDVEWDVLRLLSRGLTYHEVADAIQREHGLIYNEKGMGILANRALRKIKEDD